MALQQSQVVFFFNGDHRRSLRTTIDKHHHRYHNHLHLLTMMIDLPIMKWPVFVDHLVIVYFFFCFLKISVDRSAFSNASSFGRKKNLCICCPSVLVIVDSSQCLRLILSSLSLFLFSHILTVNVFFFFSFFLQFVHKYIITNLNKITTVNWNSILCWRFEMNPC